MPANSFRASLRALPRGSKRVITIAVDVASVAVALLVTLLVQRDAAGALPNGVALFSGLRCWLLCRFFWHSAFIKT